jgi:hypothetical protein
MTQDDEEIRDWREGKSPEEQERILHEARQARTTIIVVAAIAIGGMVFLFLIMILLLALK